MRMTAQALLASLLVVAGMHATDANAGPFKFRFSSEIGPSSGNENSLTAYVTSESRGVHDEVGGRDGQNDPFDLISTLENESNDDGHKPRELSEFESPASGITNILDLPIENEVTAQAVREPSTVALLLAPIALLLARRAKR